MTLGMCIGIVFASSRSVSVTLGMIVGMIIGILIGPINEKNIENEGEIY